MAREEYAPTIDAPEVSRLKREFDSLGLDPAEMLGGELGKAEGDHVDPAELLRWAKAYRACPERKKLEARGFRFPPVAVDIDPETDWLRFERWMRGEPASWSFPRDFGELKPEEEMTDAEVSAELERVTGLVAERGVCFDIPETVPDRAVYRYVRSRLADTVFEYMAPGAMHVFTGCDGWCPDCFRRAWCDLAGEFESA